MTHPKLQRLNDLAKDAPAGPWVPCRANEDTCGCACGQIWSGPLDHPVATAHKEDDDFQTSPENTIATMRFISEANPDTIQKLIQALGLNSSQPLNSNPMTTTDKLPFPPNLPPPPKWWIGKKETFREEHYEIEQKIPSVANAWTVWDDTFPTLDKAVVGMALGNAKGCRVIRCTTVREVVG